MMENDIGSQQSASVRAIKRKPLRTGESMSSLAKEQRQNHKHATANIFEIDPLIISSSQTDSKLPVTASGSDVPYHNSWAEPSQSAGGRGARNPQACSTISESVGELLLAIVPLAFLVFGCLIYGRREQPVDQHGNALLLSAARYGPTIFPIFFAAIFARFLRALAAVKLEQGARVLTLEYLLHSRTVFSAVSAPFDLRKFHILTPLLILLWALSPLGGQASLRVVSVRPLYTNTTHNFTYLSFVSPFTNQGVGSASAEPLAPINAAFTTFLTSSAASKASPQDPFGNIKIPILDTLPGNSDWRNVPDTQDVVWSSLTGIPVYQPPTSGVSRFTMNTGYMTTDCVVSGEAWAHRYMQSISNLTGAFGGWSGANFAIEVGPMDAFQPTYFIFRSLATMGDTTEPQPLTAANCSVSMNYVEAQIACNGSTCRPTAIRPSIEPANHPANNIISTSLNSSQFTPLNSLGQPDILFLSFWRDFINSTDPFVGCDTSFCVTSSIEGYLADPNNPFSFSNENPVLWTVDEKLISQRFSQLVNTYWIDSIGPLIVSSSGIFNLTRDNSSVLQVFNTDTSIGSIETEVNVIMCDYAWLAILLVSSLVLLLSAVATAVLTNLRRGPDILDRFSSLLRDDQYVCDPQHSSMEDAFEQSRRLGDVRVRLGDVRPEREVGYAAIALIDGRIPVQKLKSRRVYA